MTPAQLQITTVMFTEVDSLLYFISIINALFNTYKTTYVLPIADWLHLFIKFDTI